MGHHFAASCCSKAALEPCGTAQETADCSPDRMQKVVFANGPAQASSHFETRNDGDGLCRPRSAGLGHEPLQLRPVVRELAAAIEANHVCPCHGCCCNAAAQLAAHGDGEGAPSVPTTEDHIEQTHKSSSIEAAIHAASRHFRSSPKARTRFRVLSGRFRTGRVNRARAASTNRLHPAKTQSGR